MSNWRRIFVKFAIVFVCAGLFIPPASVSQNVDFDYIGSTLWGYAQAIEVADNHAYCVMPYGLMIFDVSDVSSPLLISQLYLEGSGKDIEVSGAYAYIAEGYSGLKIVNISDPNNPFFIGGCDAPGFVIKVHLYGNYIYAINNHEGLQIFNVANPFNPFFATTFDSNVEVLFIDGQYAFMDGGQSYANFRIFDLADPLNPVLIGSTAIDSLSAYAISVRGNYAYLTSRWNYYSALYIIDVTSPSNPHLISVYETADRVDDIAFYGNYAYLNESPGIEIIDISNPEFPSPVSVYGQNIFPSDLFVSGSRLYYCHANIHVLDIFDPVNPTLIGSYVFPGLQFDYAIDGNYAYVATSDGVCIVDFSDPNNPNNVATYESQDWALDVFIDSVFAFIANGTSGLQIINISNPGNPSPISTYDAGVLNVYLSGNYAYLGCGYDGLQIVDVSDQLNPTLTGSYVPPSYITDVYISGDYAYLTTNTSGLYIVDISNPNNPTFIGNYIDNFPAWSYEAVFVVGSYAYVTGRGPFRSLLILDISDPANPSFISHVIDSSNCRGAGITIYGNYAYLATFNKGMVIFDISDPTSPQKIFQYNSPLGLNNVTMGQNFLFWGSESGLFIFEYRLLAGCEYTVGDINNSGGFNGLDITYGVTFFKGGSAPPYECECAPGVTWYVAGDVNSSCNYNGLDITYGVAYFKGGPDPIPCPDCPPY